MEDKLSNTRMIQLALCNAFFGVADFKNLKNVLDMHLQFNQLKINFKVYTMFFF